ncbi:MAG: DNA-directed RNA polymerase subunit beta', partial [Clostridia bacterium]|nr:DNA-directed RNA polymerase subunit beta' [Clostridia bacterium]
DYSGRSVIVVGPELKMYQCGLPKEMAIELFKPFVMKRLVETGVAGNIKSARKMVDRMRPEVWDALEIVIKDHPVMLNRAPTLHRLGIQAFEPVLVEGRAIKLHPLVCTAFNADFDGDQMAVHVPLSAEAQAEARFLMLAAGNLLKPSDGKPVAVPTQDMILGSYYLTIDNHEKDSAEATKEAKENTNKIFRDENEAMMAYDNKAITLHDDIKIRRVMEIDGVTVSHLVKTTIGRVIFNRAVPQDLGFTDRSPRKEGETDKDYFDRMMGYEIDFKVGKKQLGKIVAECIKKHGTAMTSTVLDAIKSQGYHYSTIGALTVAVGDATIPEMKKTYIAEAEARVDQISDMYQMGLMSDDERYAHVIATWNETTDKVTKALIGNMDPYNPIQMMADSGARGSISQIRQLAGMRGLIANTSGKTIEVPIRANYREGLNILEYFTSAKGARKGLADTALRTADSGYLTRRLVDVSQEVIIRETDCGTTDGIDVYDIKDGNRIIEPLTERLQGRFLCEDFCDADGNVLVDRDHQMNEADAKLIDKVLRANATDAEGNVDDSKVRVKIRSVLKCAAEKGVCACCYGANLATTDRVTVGEAVGIIAAQSIGEPGTQLTMRTFHTGGVAGGEDITQGLPRVEELFEGRKPKMLAQISEITGVVRREEKKKNLVIVTSEDGTEERTYVITYGSRLRSCIEDGYVIQKGECITEGSMSPHDVLEVCGESAVQDYLIKEVQITYRTQGVDINDKHIEVIVRQMMRKVRVEDSGDTNLINDAVVDKSELYVENKSVQARIAAGEVNENGEPLRTATVTPILLGITKASLATDSFLSAASFQETTRVLTDAAIKGKVDPLLGLKENVIIGKLIPAGTGMQVYNDVRVRDNRAPKNAFSVLDELLVESDEDEEGQPELLDEE